jgi:hypothetical protein
MCSEIEVKKEKLEINIEDRRSNVKYSTKNKDAQ